MKHILIGYLIIAILVFVVFLIRYLVSSIKYARYIKEKHPDKWQELTTSRFLGAPVSTGKGGKFFWSDDYLDDKQILNLKSKIKLNMVYMFTSLVAFVAGVFMLYLFTDIFQ